MDEVTLGLLRAFRLHPFALEEATKRLRYSERYLRNVVSSALERGILLSSPAAPDRRRRQYRVSWRALREEMLKGGEARDRVVHALGLEPGYEGKYVALVDGVVVDFDDDLLALTDRVADRYPAEALLVTNVGEPRQPLTMGL